MSSMIWTIELIIAYIILFKMQKMDKKTPQTHEHLTQNFGQKASPLTAQNFTIRAYPIDL